MRNAAHDERVDAALERVRTKGVVVENETLPSGSIILQEVSAKGYVTLDLDTGRYALTAYGHERLARRNASAAQVVKFDPARRSPTRR